MSKVGWERRGEKSDMAGCGSRDEKGGGITEWGGVRELSVEGSVDDCVGGEMRMLSVEVSVADCVRGEARKLSVE